MPGALVARKSVSSGASPGANEVAQKISNKNKIPPATVEEYKDKSLRLADILDEVSMNIK